MIPRRLLGAFNRTDAVAIPDAASAVPAILAEGSLPSAAEAAAVAVLAEFRRKAEETRELHASTGLVESRRIAEQGLAIRRFGQNERLGDSTIRRFSYCGWSAQPA